MQFTGFERRCAKRTGGVEALFLVEAGDIAAVDYDTVQKVFRGVQLRPGVQVARYDFSEESCSLTETLRREDGLESVLHEIAFRLAGNDPAVSKALREFSEAESGLAAIVLMAEGETLLVGYSHTFGGERPLRISSAERSSGKRFEDAPGSAVALQSEDTSFACFYTGSLP